MTAFKVPLEKIGSARDFAKLHQEETFQKLRLGRGAAFNCESGDDSPYLKILKRMAEGTGKPTSLLTRREEDNQEPQRRLSTLSQHSYRSRKTDAKKVQSAFKSVLNRLQCAPLQLSETRAALEAALMTLET